MVVIFLKPGTVIVQVLDKSTKHLLRTNVINVCPETDVTCNVMFRDICHYDSGLLFDPMIYNFVAKIVISAIFDQDIRVGVDQQSNVDMANYHTTKFCMPAPADRAIVAFRAWCRRAGL